MKLYLCEKPSQGRDLAAVLGITDSNKTHINTKDGIVTWCFGHLLGIPFPDHYDPKWKSWSLATLPIQPERFTMVPTKNGEAQLRVVQKMLSKVDEVVIATDADREGESIAREVLEYANYSGKIARLWLSALDPESIRNALGKLKTEAQTRNLYFAALGRSRADWLVGMNYTRAVTLRYGKPKQVLNIGRVQTPTFGLVVKRDREIANFKSRDYFELELDVATQNGNTITLNHAPKEENRIWDKTTAEQLASSATGQNSALTVKKEPKKTAPPKLFDLTSFQRFANSSWGWSADRALKIAQALYETHKLTTYPRSDSVFLPEEQIADADTILTSVSQALGFDKPSNPVIRKTVFNSNKVTAHHAIIPTKLNSHDTSKLNTDEMKAFDAIARRYVANFLPDYEFEQTTVFGKFGVMFGVRGNITTLEGWKAVLKVESKDTVLPPIQNGETGTGGDCRVIGKQTKPPSHYTEATLIADMENVAKFVDDPRLAKILKGKEKAGIGTVATRAAIIEGLKKNEFIAAKGKKLHSTPKSNALYDTLSTHLPHLLDPAETAIWEDTLENIASGDDTLDQFLGNIRTNIHDGLSKIGSFDPANQKHANGNGTSPKPNLKATNLVSFHSKHSGEPIAEDDKSWRCPGYGRIPKTIFGRDFQWEEMKQILLEKKSELLDFKSKAGKPYQAYLLYKGQDPKWKSPSFKLEFPPKK